MQPNVKQDLSSQNEATPYGKEVEQSPKDAVSGKKKKRRRLKGLQIQSSEKVAQHSLNVDAEHSNYSCIEDEGKGPDESRGGLEEYPEEVGHVNETAKEFYQRDIEEKGQNQSIGLINITSNSRPTLLHEVGSLEVRFAILFCTPFFLLL